MNATPQQIVSDDDIEVVHANANFGSMSKRDGMNEGVLTYAFGYVGGQFQILKEHGLFGGHGALTRKGFDYLKAVFRDVPFSDILQLAK